MRAPALKAVVAFCAGIVLSHFVIIPLNYIGIILLISCILYLILGIAKSKYLNLLIFIIIGIAGMLWYEVRTTLFPENHIKNHLNNPDHFGIVYNPLYESNKVRVKSRIIRDPDIRENQTILECQAESIFVSECRGVLQYAPTTGKIGINLKYLEPSPMGEHIGSPLQSTPKGFEYGALIETYGKLWFPEFPRNPESFDYGAYLKQKDIYCQMNIYAPEDIRIIGKQVGNPAMSKIALPIKKYIRNTIDKYLGWIQGPFLKAIVIGERGQIPARINEYFQNTGTIHILAVSGTNVGIIAVIIFLALSVFRVPLIPKQIITSILLVIYAFITGLQPPIVRATIMSIFAMIALTIERDSDILNIMGFAGLFILFINPQSLFDVSFLLSFGTLVWIVYLYPKIYPLLFRERRIEGTTGIRNLMLLFYRPTTYFFTASLCAQLGIMPIIAYQFFKVPIVSIIANIFVIPLTGVCIALTFVMSLLNLLPWQIPIQISAGATWAVTTFTLKIVEWFDKVPYAYSWVGKPSILVIGFYYILLLSIVNLPVSRVARKVFVYGLLIFLNLTVWSKVYRICHPELKVTYLDVSHGDCTFIELPNGNKTLIDAGSWRRGGSTSGRLRHQRGSTSSWDAGTYTVAPFLRSKGITTIDLMIATNPKIYRIGGMRYIIENFKVKEFICPASAHPSWTWLNLLELLERKGINCKIVNADNISSKLDYKGISFLFAGDDVVEKLPLSSQFTVISVPKHGSKRCFSREWVRNVAPKLAIISCGRNPWGEPDIDVINEYKTIGAEVLRTDKEGAITITTNGDTLQIETMRHLRL